MCCGCREELPAAIKSRKDKHVTREDLKRLLVEAGEGPFQPRLQQLVASNPPELVVQCSAAAFRILPDVRAAITELCTLRGVGPATASAVLAAGAPEVAAFMSDGAVAAVPGLPALHYTPKDYFLYLGQVRESAAALNQGSQLMGAGWEGTQDAIKVQVASAREPQSPVVLPSECLRAVDLSPCGDSAVDLGCGTEAVPRHAT